MKIAIITPTLSGRGGEETVIREILCSKLNSAIKFKLIVLGKLGESDWLNDIKADKFISNSENEISNFLLFHKIIKTNHFDEIICISRKSILFSYLIRKFSTAKFKILSWIHFNLNDVNTRFLKLADYHLAISTTIAKQLEEKKIAKKNQIFTIYNPIKKNKAIVYKAHSHRFIYVGRITFHGQKNIKELIDNLAQLPFTDWILDVYGDGNDKKKCQEYIAENYPKLAQNFRWNGWQVNPWENIKEAGAILLTSNYEGLPMVLLESISRGLPCLVSSNSGGDDIIKHGVNGEIYIKGNSKNFEVKLIELLNTNYDTKQVKNSISKFYTINYFKYFMQVLYEVQ